MIPYAGLSFTSYERIKRYVLTTKMDYLAVQIKKDNEPDDPHKYYELTVPGRLICGGATAVVAQTITYPLDVVRRHMQLVTMITDSVTRQ